jgi:hypothetical protein
MHLSAQSIRRVLACGSPHIRRDGASASFTLICTVEEGAGLRFGSGDWNDPALEELTSGIVEELGWKEVEHSARRQTVVRCTVPENDASRAACEADRGEGFEPIAMVRESGG